MADPSYIVDGVLEDSESWVSVASTTLSSDTATVTFTSPDDGSSKDWSQFMDLVLIIYARTAGAGSTDRQMNMKLNNDTGSNYMAQRLSGVGAGAYAGKTENGPRWEVGVNPSNNASANIFGVTVTTLFDINSGKFKSGLSQAACDMDGSGYFYLWSLMWKSPDAVTTIGLFDLYGSDLRTASRFDLFGILPRMVS